MIMDFYKNNSPVNKVNKSLTQIGSATDLNVAPADYDEESPVFTMSKELPSGADYVGFNGLYYFINGVNYTSNGLYELSCSLDYLYSFRDDILDAKAYIDRASTSMNKYVPNNTTILESAHVSERVNIGGGFADTEEAGTYILVTSQRGYN